MAITYDVAEGIGTIRIDRPEKRNAVTDAMLRELWAAFDEASTDDAARAILFTGVPGACCAGTDLSDLSGTPEDERQGGGGRGSASAFLDCPKPIVAAIDGPAVGMGAELASMCDVRVGTERARFGWVFVHRGLVPDTGAGTWLLPRLVGVQTAARLLFSGEIIDAREAHDIGFLSRLVASDELEAAARAEAARFTAGSPFAIRQTKELLYAGWDDHVAANRKVMERCFASEDHREGVAAFLERRPAVFTGR